MLKKPWMQPEENLPSTVTEDDCCRLPFEGLSGSPGIGSGTGGQKGHVENGAIALFHNLLGASPAPGAAQNWEGAKVA